MAVKGEKKIARENTSLIQTLALYVILANAHPFVHSTSTVVSRVIQYIELWNLALVPHVKKGSLVYTLSFGKYAGGLAFKFY